MRGGVGERGMGGKEVGGFQTLGGGEAVGSREAGSVVDGGGVLGPCNWSLVIASVSPNKSIRVLYAACLSLVAPRSWHSS